MAFAALFPSELAPAATEEGTSAAIALRGVHAEAEAMWQAASEDPEVRACVEEALSLMPTEAEVTAAPAAAAAWLPSGEALRRGEALAVERYGW